MDIHSNLYFFNLLNQQLTFPTSALIFIKALNSNYIYIFVQIIYCYHNIKYYPHEQSDFFKNLNMELCSWYLTTLAWVTELRHQVIINLPRKIQMMKNTELNMFMVLFQSGLSAVSKSLTCKKNEFYWEDRRPQECFAICFNIL